MSRDCRSGRANADDGECVACVLRAERVRGACYRAYHRLCCTHTLTVPRGASTIGARDDVCVCVLVSTRDKIREALTLVSFRD